MTNIDLESDNTGDNPATAVAGDDFSIDNAFADFMGVMGGTAQDAGGTVTFTGRDPIVRSHFRLGSCMAIPAMAAATGAAAIWRDRTGQVQGHRQVVDLVWCCQGWSLWRVRRGTRVTGIRSR
jgi:hypothetical protein